MVETAEGRLTSLSYAVATIIVSPLVRAAREQPVDGLGGAWSDGRAFIGGIVAVDR